MRNIFLSVVVPYYKETQRDVFPLLSSLNNQVGVDYSRVEVLLVNDGANNVLPDSFLSMFHNLNPRTLCLPENRGPGVARQAGLDAAQGEYVMFCDADDTLHSVAVLGAFMQERRSCRTTGPHLRRWSEGYTTKSARSGMRIALRRRRLKCGWGALGWGIPALCHAGD